MLGTTVVSRKDPRFFERLPPELRQSVFSRLDYHSLIRLSQCNKMLREAVDPQTAPWTDKFTFTLQAENYFKRHFPGVVEGKETLGNLACYFCFRVRSPDYFDQKQHHLFRVEGNGRYRKLNEDDVKAGLGRSAVALRRYCIECGVRHGIHAPGDLLRTKMGQEFWVCNCWRVWLKPSCLRCDDCRANCPFSTKAD